jgi:3-mercaptopyruvate sulfurtransferase SseA
MEGGFKGWKSAGLPTKPSAYQKTVEHKSPYFG